jgi:hypothetical protein
MHVFGCDSSHGVVIQMSTSKGQCLGSFDRSTRESRTIRIV